MTQQQPDRPFDEIDFALMLATAIVPPHWPWALLLGVSTATRRSPRAAALLMDAFGADRAPQWLLPGAASVPEDRERKALPVPRLSLPWGRGNKSETIDGDDLVRREPSQAQASPRAAAQAQPERRQGWKRAAPKDPAEEAMERGNAMLDWPVYDSNPDTAWGPTLITAKPRHGKSQVQIGRMVADIEADHEVVWMSTHATLYHEQDQPVDLRPIASRFEVISRGDAIRDRLKYYVDEVMEPRIDLYTAGQDVGHTIALHIGEWPALVEKYGEEVAAPMRRLLREAPKTRVIVSTLDAQDAQVNTLGLGSGVRNSFWHILLGNVDAPSWRAFTDEPYRKVPAREWYVPGQGVVRFPRAIERVQRLAAAMNPPAPIIAHTEATTRLAAPAPADDLLASLLATMSPDRAARLQAIQGTQTVERVDAGPTQVVVNVAQVVTTPTRQPKDEARKRALCNYYRDMGAAGVPFDEVYAEHKGTKGDVFPAWQEGKKLHNETKSHSEAS